MPNDPLIVLIYELADAPGLTRELLLSALNGANQIMGKKLFCVNCTSDSKLLDSFSGHAIVFSGPNMWPSRIQQSQQYWEVLRQKSSQGIHVIATANGVVHLAGSGMLDGKRVAADWQLLESLRIKYPELNASASLFEWAPPLTSCSGGLAVLHLALHWIRLACGAGISNQVADWLQCDKIRQGSDRQKVPLKTYLGAQEPKLLESVSLMEANVEEPLATSEIADYLGISRRQLERLFKKHLQEVPSRYYLNIRLDAAKKLLLESTLTIVEIGARCGFSSGPHFSTAYRQRFEQTPREERSQFLKPVE